MHEIILNGLRLDPEQVCADGRIVLADLGGSNELRVTADFRYTGDGSALHRSVDPADGKVSRRRGQGAARQGAVPLHRGVARAAQPDR